MFPFFHGRIGLRDAFRRVATCAGVMLLLTGTAQAQHNHAAPAAPATPSATAMPPAMADKMPSVVSSAASLGFDSVLARYKPMTDQKLGSWREANDTVTRIGGWRAYLKEAQTPDVMEPKAPAAPAASHGGPVMATPDPMPHEGHRAK